MVRKNWIMFGCVLTLAAVLCAVSYAEKGEMKGALPAAVQAAVKALYPAAIIDKSKMEEEDFVMYEVEMKDAGKNVSMNVAADGTVGSIETVESMDSLPAAVMQTIKAQDGNAVKVEKEVKKAELKLVKLANPVTTYEAKIVKDGKETEVVISADGKIVKQEVKGKEKGEDEEHEGHEQK